MIAGAPVHAASLSLDHPLIGSMTYLDAARAGVRVVAVGDRGSIVYSDDEGATWQQAATSSDVLLTAVCFVDARRGWAVGHDAVVLVTEDGGTSWTQQYSDVLGADPADVQEESADEDYDDYDNYDDYDDYGDDAAMVDTSGAPFLDVFCGSHDHVVAVGGYGYVIESTDGGVSWVRRSSDMPNPDGWHLYDIARIPDTSTLLVAGEKGTLLRSRDNGASWQKLKSPYEGTFFGITVTEGVVLVHGMQGKVWATRDAGNSWRQIKTGVSRAVNDGVVLSDGTIVLVGSSGTVLVSHDNASSLALQYLPDRESVSGVVSLNDGGLLMVGDQGINIVHGIR